MTFKPHIAIITNLSPDHLERYKDNFENYINSTFNLVLNQVNTDYLIYNSDDVKIVSELIRRKIHSIKIPFSFSKTNFNNQVYIEKNIIKSEINKNKFMIITTTETIPNKEITEALGIARGSTVRARNVARDLFAGIKNLIGGEIEEYTKLQAQSREQALSRMIEDAKRVGADAVVNVRFMTSVISQGAAEVLAYGTSVKIK